MQLELCPNPPNSQTRPLPTSPKHTEPGSSSQLPFVIITAELPSPSHYLLLLPLPRIAGDRETIKAQNISFWTGRASFGRKLPLFSPSLPLLLGREGKGKVWFPLQAAWSTQSLLSSDCSGVNAPLWWKQNRVRIFLQGTIIAQVSTSELGLPPLFSQGCCGGEGAFQ